MSIDAGFYALAVVEGPWNKSGSWEETPSPLSVAPWFLTFQASKHGLWHLLTQLCSSLCPFPCWISLGLPSDFASGSPVGSWLLKLPQVISVKNEINERLSEHSMNLSRRRRSDYELSRSDGPI